MATNNIVLLDLKIGTTQADQSLEDIKSAIDEICDKIGSIGTALENAFSFDTGNVSTFQDAVSTIADSSKILVDNLTKANELMKPQEESWLDGIIEGIDGFNTVADGLTNMEDISDAISDGLEAIKDKPDESFNIFKALIPDTYELTGELGSSAIQFVNDYMEAVKTATPEVGKFNAMFPALGTALGDAKLKMGELATSIATTVTAIPGRIATIAGETATWIANTAAKVANSVAQWAQNAATTAWTAICTAATAVTSAFGAVLTFLTSPIGLVIIGITALIAIVVLLIANWDTVSAKAKEVWGFVQAKFAEFDAFLQNVFAKDFTEQFGAFGHILNAFFANVEGIWNAIKRIFSGIVTFISSVFAGDWSSAWNGIVEVFGGIWDGIVALVKTPINGLIGYINAMISAVVSGVNCVIRAVNGLSIQLPDWDFLGSNAGRTFGFNIPLLGGVEIPLLAQGAVLPANRPFMAIVGDQRYGTNVEAPLSTIQEAVAQVMVGPLNAVLDCLNDSVDLQQRLLGAVAGIKIGDEVIGRAARRYERRQAMMGGYY